MKYEIRQSDGTKQPKGACPIILMDAPTKTHIFDEVEIVAGEPPPKTFTREGLEYKFCGMHFVPANPGVTLWKSMWFPIYAREVKN